MEDAVLCCGVRPGGSSGELGGCGEDAGPDFEEAILGRKGVLVLIPLAAAALRVGLIDP